MLKIKTQETINLYVRTDETFFSYKYQYQLHDILNNKLNIKTYDQIKEQIIGKEIVQHNFIIGSLVKNPLSNREFLDQQFPIVLKIKVPKGTHAGYLGKNSFFKDWNHMIIKRDYKLKYNGMHITNGVAKDLIVIQAELKL